MKLVNDEMIKKHEALRLEAYMPTPNDVPTIGWGHTHGVRMGDKITLQEAEKLFRQDIEWAENAVNNMVKINLSQNQFDALVSLVFNIGAGGFANSTVLRQLNNGNIQGAADAFRMWNKQTNRKTGKKEVLRGLVKRREEERAYFLLENVPQPVRKPENGSQGLSKFLKALAFVWRNR